LPDRFRGRAHALQIGAGAGLAHGDGADHFAGGELRQPAPLLLLGAVAQDVGRDDARMQRRAERVEAGERIFAVDHRFMGERAAGAAIFLRHRSAEQTGRAGLGPHLARIEVLLVPFSRCGTNSAAMKRRAWSSSRTTSSVIHAGRGRLSTSLIADPPGCSR
jgi:hypothetical protein